MKTIKKLTLLCLALATAATASFAVACGGDDSSSSSSSSSPLDFSSSSSVEDDLGYKDAYPETCVGDEACAFGDWELVKEADCTTKGVKARYCAENSEHVDYETFAARGHNYGNTGVCITCETEASLPAPKTNPTYLNPNDPDDRIYGNGEDFDRYLLYVGDYCEIEMGSEDIWFEFPVDEPGQYAVISTENAGGVEIERYDASAHYITPTPYPGRELADGNFVATVLCAENLWSTSWTATFCLDGSDGDVVRFYIVKIADAAWTPSYVTVNMEAKELSGVAANGAEGTVPADVPYDSEYFYDEESGYYRMGTAEDPGEIIYAAISSSATRLMGEMAFTGLPEAGASISLDGGVNIEGNYLVYNYAPFMYSEPLHGGSENSYAAFANEDGLHPVTKELHDFLQHYVSENAPSVPPEEGFEANAWLAPCYYYTKLQAGSEAYPIEITELGAFQAVPYNGDEYVYYTFTYDPNPEATGATTTYCTISVSTDNVRLRIGGNTYDNANGSFGIDKIPFETNSETGITFSFLSREWSTDPINVTIELLEGSSDDPITLETLGEVTLTPIAILSATGTVSYEAYYAYTATEAGTITLSTTSNAQFLLNESVLENGSASVIVAAGETVTVYVSATSADPVSVTLTVS